ncbi:MAG: DUF2312 domain-containing protein [Magnetococcales bacterium]|nr:DUF2312 domain-containing protein [Magnetococcales bacterium]
MSEEDSGGIAADQLRQMIERIERLEEEKNDIAAHIREIYAEGKSTGFDPKVMRLIVRMRKMDQRELDEQEALTHLYKQALGMS